MGGTPLRSGLDPAPKIRPLSGLPSLGRCTQTVRIRLPASLISLVKVSCSLSQVIAVFSDFLLLGALAGLGLPRRCPVHISGRAVPLLPVSSPVALLPHPGDGSFLASVLRPGVPSAPLAHVVWCHLCLGGLTLLSAESIHGVSGSWTPSPRPDPGGAGRSWCAIDTSHCYPFSTGDRVTDLIQGGPFPKGPGCSFNNRLGVAGRKGRARWIWEGCGLQGRRRRLIRRRTDGRTDGVDAGRSAGAEERQPRPESHEGTWAPLLRRVVRVSAVGCGLCPRGGKRRVLKESQAISGQRGKTPEDLQ